MDYKATALSSKRPERPKKRSLTIEGMPPELRQAIWQLTLNNNRIVTIQGPIDRSDDLWTPTTAQDFSASFEKIEAPAVSFESRAIAKKEYTIRFENDMKNSVYFNGERDILKFTDTTFMEIVYHQSGDIWKNEDTHIAGVQRIVIDMRDARDMLTMTGRSIALILLLRATQKFYTLRQIFLQPTFPVDSAREEEWRVFFADLMRNREREYGRFVDGHYWQIPEIVLVSLEDDPDLLKAVQRSSSDPSTSPESDGNGIFARVPRELEDQIWSLVPTGTGPRLIEITADLTMPPCRDQDGRFEFGEKQFEIKIINHGKSLARRDSNSFPPPSPSQDLNSKAFNLSHNRFRFDYKIKNPQIVNIAQDIFFFDGLDRLDDYVEATRGITESVTLSSQPRCYPTIQNAVVRVCLNMGGPESESYASWLKNLRSQPDFHKSILTTILPELLQPISRVKGLKSIYLLVNEEEIPGDGPIERIDGRLMELLVRDDKLRRCYEDDFQLPEVLCLTMEEFTREFGRVSRRLCAA
ncbi:hypothetical protein SBOR_7512 [Sclerotinia borealis F-4128]|uniref:2EXR domain-containing protein n=1 Tax=Sclerotinia borealis (strain F-4128) TaxID=1432307 RepID=W9C5R1_SCLBF|nr:hypothetical protein SBOR_7512 [Sclerotinia borealis F-4128]